MFLNQMNNEEVFLKDLFTESFATELNRYIALENDGFDYAE